MRPVGNLAEYIRASGDMLQGQVQMESLGERVWPEVWTEEGVEIAPDAQFYGRCSWGKGAKVKGGVIIHGPTVIQDYSVVDRFAHIEHSIIWRNCYIGENVELRGAIVGQQCSLKRKSVVFEGGV